MPGKTPVPRKFLRRRVYLRSWCIVALLVAWTIPGIYWCNLAIAGLPTPRSISIFQFRVLVVVASQLVLIGYFAFMMIALRRALARAKALDYAICPSCGYDLSGTSDSDTTLASKAQQCPECGIRVTRAELIEHWQWPKPQ